MEFFSQITNNLYSFFWMMIVSTIIYRCGRVLVNVLTAIWVYCLAPKLGIGVDFSRYADRWTIVTGSTDSIGKAYVMALAENGIKNFLLISRDAGRLRETASFLKSKYGDVQIAVFPFTFGKDNRQKLRDFVHLYDVGILINNVGTGPKNMKRFGEDPENDELVYRVNTESVFDLTQCVIPKMVAAKSGIIVNVSSSQSIRPVPYLATYSATKVFISYLSDCMSHEYRKHGIIVQCVVPFMVATKLVYYENQPNLFVVAPLKFAREAVKTIGVSSYTTGCWSHDLQRAVLYFLPWWILRHLVAPIYAYESRRITALQAAKDN